jgi:heptose-I-phosphate ethanolaminephosphotransferase
MHSTEITARLAHEEFDIRMWFWCSERYREAHPDVVEFIRKASTLRYMTDALPHTLLRLAGISTRWYRPSLDILSDEYDDERPRILKLTTDYDKLGK